MWSCGHVVMWSSAYALSVLLAMPVRLLPGRISLECLEEYYQLKVEEDAREAAELLRKPGPSSELKCANML